MSIESVMPSNHLILYTLFSSRLQSFPALGSFPVNPLLPVTGRAHLHATQYLHCRDRQFGLEPLNPKTVSYPDFFF